MAASAGALTGCPLSVPESLPQVRTAGSESGQADGNADAGEQPLSQLIADTLQRNLQTRALSTQLHGAWQILHGVLAYGREFIVETPDGTKPTIDYLLGGGEIRGFEPMFGDRFGDDARRGLRMELAPDNKVSQGHRDQWLAVLCQCDLPLETEVRGGDHVFTFADWLNQAEWDVPLNLELEFSWTLIALSAYRSTDHSWVARDGETYSTELLLESEIERDLEQSACGGTHRLIGIATALRKRIAEQMPVTGVWQRAQQLVSSCIAESKENQNPDGTYSTAYFHRPGWVRDLGETLGTTGHVLEFLSIAADQQTLHETWVVRGVRKLCGVLDQCDGIDLECGGLYHALHGLVEYQRRTTA
ncbi:ADP-ribosylation factor-directed GTPase activating protein isoform b [Stieleria varia]|uniref:Uncharacterized protein n=1 Tax=Stieleria varia TaxID=2528005 RepID=A0A5C6ATJ1_9BACT|nr:ADP-ribosylation factor-directed GTPase activating protein isoform b [Stieleria varia]TWU02579.1 hypothetical protein Pla52n_36290 [Stieleria varia]